MKKEKNINSEINEKERRMFIFISWILGVFVLFFLLVSLYFCGIQYCEIFSQPYMFYLMLILGIVLFILPFIRRLRIGKLFEIENEIIETQEELRDFKQEFRSTISVVSNLSNITNVYNIPSSELNKVMKIKQDLEESSDNNFIKESGEIRDQLSLMNQDDINLSLARTRMRFEYLLRIILKKKIVREKIEEDIRYMSIRKLLDFFIIRYPKYENLKPGFEYVIRLANAAIHAQRVPADQAMEALDLGAQLIATLENIARDERIEFQ